MDCVQGIHGGDIKNDQIPHLNTGTAAKKGYQKKALSKAVPLQEP